MPTESILECKLNAIIGQKYCKPQAKCPYCEHQQAEERKKLEQAEMLEEALRMNF